MFGMGLKGSLSTIDFPALGPGFTRMVFMDQEIEQLLHSLNVTTAPVERQAVPPSSPAVPLVKKVRPSLFTWIRQRQSSLLWIGCSLLLVKVGILTFFFIYGVPEQWIFRARKLIRVHEAPVVEEMAPIHHAFGERVGWSGERPSLNCSQKG